MSKHDLDIMQLEIVDYQSSLRDRFRTLNEEWLEKYFCIEPIDTELLSDPEGVILDKGGCVFFALLDGKAVGTGSVIPLAEEVYELGKMAVTADVQGLGIGRLLAEYAIRWTRERKGVELILYSNSRLERALDLYRKLGFVHTDVGVTPYKRSDVRMSLDLRGGVSHVG